MPPPEWLVDTILPEGGLIALYGPSGTGKSFIAIDMAMAIATGTPWQGHPVKKGFVIYVSAEGGTGIGKRVKAWLFDRKMEAKEANVAWLVEAVPIHTDSENMEILLERILEEIGETPVLIILDTLARCFDGNENQQEDMNRFIAGIDRLRKECKSAVLVVHHTNKQGEDERGSGAFRGASDAMLSVVKKEERIFLRCSKQKDDEEFGDREVLLKDVPECKSLVVALGRTIRKIQRVSSLLSLLEEKGSLTHKEWLEESGMAAKTFGRYLATLRQEGKIIRKNNQYEAV